MIPTDLLSRLRRIVGSRHVCNGRADAEVYGYDASLAVGAPDAVVLPADTQQTAEVVRAAARCGVPYVPRGYGTNLSGGSVPAAGGLVVELSRLNRVLDVESEGRYAVVQTGATNLELQNVLAPLRFSYAPDPASQKVATLGGNVGENSGGPHCLKYGVTTNHILGMTLVLPGGDVVEVGGPALDPPGYDLRGLLVGSEGTLAVVTELIVRILPLPESVVTLLAVFDDVAEAARSVSAVIAAGMVPATLEMMDATVIRAVEDSKPCGYPRDAAAVLIAEVDGPAVGLPRQAERIGQLCRENGCREVRRAKDAAERNLLWAGRRGAFGAIARLAPNYLVADCTVPRTLLPAALEQVAAIASKHDLEHGNVFHAGDGNLHPLLLFDSRDSDQLRRVHRAGHEIMQQCAALGGTITGEHGIGMEKTEAMRMIFSEDDLDFQRRIRRAFDPDDLLNPGKIVPAPENGKSEEQGSVSPGEAEEACETIRRAAEKGLALLPSGAGTRADFGNYSPRETIPLRSDRLAGIIEHDPANQLVIAGSGTPLAAVQDALIEAGQWLPIRPPPGNRVSLGGVVALAACGPERLRYGAPRDLLLGLKFISGSGRLISAGGRVVKNVAGYDVTRLMTGSAGTLGFLTELTMRVYPLPECCTQLVASGDLDRCRAAAAELLGSQLEPAMVVAVSDRPGIEIGDTAAWRLLAAFEGFEETVAWQSDNCRALMERAGLEVRTCSNYTPREGPCGEFFDWLEPAAFLLRVDLSPDRVGGFLSQPHEALAGAAVLADFGCGRISAATSDLTDRAWLELGRTMTQSGGHAILEKAPEPFKQRHDVFGPPSDAWQLSHRIKAALDPRGVFAPGRLPGRK